MSGAFGRLLLSLASLGVAHSSLCEQTYQGVCKEIFADCPSGYYDTVNYCGVLQSCCYPPPSASSNTQPPTPASAHTQHAQCGHTVFTSPHRIVGGHEATVGAYPWQVSVRVDGSHICGGTLINNQWVMTAAHCFEDEHMKPNFWSMGIGMHNLYSTHGYLHQVRNITVHEHYNPKLIINDIALVKLRKRVDITGPYIRPACLPTVNESFEQMVCTATGWGALKTDGDSPSALREVDMPIIPNSQCAYYLAKGDVTNENICAGEMRGGKDTCQGDSGGPLACKKDGVWQVAGITSWGYDCAKRNSPGIYTRVSAYVDWIHRTIANTH